MTFAVRKLTKSYGGVTVLDEVDLAVGDGEIHALLGANGAGKSTLIKCISGAISPDSGHMTIGETSFKSLTPKTAHQAGVSVVYQDLSLALSLSAAENVFLGQELRRGPFMRRVAQQDRAERWFRELGINIPAAGDLSNLGNAELQSIEIVKALVSEPEVLILDEPTAALSEHEADVLGEHLKQLRSKNLPVLYVTHRLSEVFSLADRVTVLRGGRSVLSGKVTELSRQEIVEAIVGRDVAASRTVNEISYSEDSTPVLELDKVLAPGIGPISLEVFPGEIFGVFGLVGSGRTELLETLFGARQLYSGNVKLAGEKISLNSPTNASRNGLALVPSDRLRKSIFPSLTAGNNALSSSYADLAVGGQWRRRSREFDVFEDLSEALNLQPRNIEQEARRFSGGNQQKLVVGRWMNNTKDCRVLLLDEPTQGVDVGARSEIYEALREQIKDPTRAVIATSSEPGELYQIAHRVAVLSDGRLAGILKGEDISEARLLELAHSVEHQQERMA